MNDLSPLVAAELMARNNRITDYERLGCTVEQACDLTARDRLREGLEPIAHQLGELMADTVFTGFDRLQADHRRMMEGLGK